jgi:hypothetical protein
MMQEKDYYSNNETQWRVQFSQRWTWAIRAEKYHSIRSTFVFNGVAESLRICDVQVW